MNHAGEIAELATICRPTVRSITNIGPVHLEGVSELHPSHFAVVKRGKGHLLRLWRYPFVAPFNFGSERLRVIATIRAALVRLCSFSFQLGSGFKTLS
jgi:UDP-N-acetylmuramyl pentapeptide synthase